MRYDNSITIRKLRKKPLNILSGYEPVHVKGKEQGGTLSNLECKGETN